MRVEPGHPNSGVEDGEQPIGDAEKAAIVSEIQRLYLRLTPGVTGGIMNAATSLAVGAGAVAATQVPEAFVSIPIFWSAWLLHSLMLDLEALKDGAHLRWLERIANEVLAIDIFVSETALVRRPGRRRPLVFYAWFAYSALLTIGSWIAAVRILDDQGHAESARLATVVAALVVGVSLWTALRRHTYAEDYTRRLAGRPRRYRLPDDGKGSGV